MIKNIHSACSGAYVAPVCKAFDCIPEGVICVSGNGNIDDGTVDTWSTDPELPSAFSGLDNGLLF